MKPIKLVYAVKPHAGETWVLERSKKGVALYDADDALFEEIPSAEVGMRVKFPSFWASVRHLTILDRDGNHLCFEPKKPAVARVREMVDDCLFSEPEVAAAAMRTKAYRDLAIGGGSFVLGVVITVGTFLRAASAGGMYVVTTGLLGVGIGELVRGIYYLNKANKLQRHADETD